MKTARMLCIVVGSVLAAFLVPLAARAWLASPRPVEAPMMAAVWEGTMTQQISDNNLANFTGEDGMNFYPALAVVSPTVAVAWSRQVGTDTLGYYDPYYRKSSNNGEAGWGAQTNIHATSPLTTETTRVDVAIDSDGRFHFVWSEQTVAPYGYTLYYSYTNSVVQTITETNDALATPAIAVYSNQVVHVVWSQGTSRIEYISKTIGGGAWGLSTNIRSTSMAVQPDIAVDSTGRAHVVWSEGGVDNSADIFYKNSNNWSTTFEVSSGAPNGGRSPALAVYGNNVYVVWCEFIARGTQYVRFRQSTNGGSNWGSSVRISGNPLAANLDSPTWLRPSMAIDSNEKIHVAFNGAGATSDPEDIFYVSKTRDGSWRPRENVTQSNGENDTTPAIATSGEYVHLIWTGPPGLLTSDNEYDVLYKRASIVETGGGMYLPVIMKSF